MRSHKETTHAISIRVHSHQLTTHANSIRVRSHKETTHANSIRVRSHQLTTHAISIRVRSHKETVHANSICVRSHQLTTHANSIRVRSHQLTTHAISIRVRSHQLAMHAISIRVRSYKETTRAISIGVCSHKETMHANSIRVRSQKETMHANSIRVRSKKRCQAASRVDLTCALLRSPDPVECALGVRMGDAEPDDRRAAASPALLRPLWATRFRLTLAPDERLALPPSRRGIILRGAFGLSYRRLVCHDLSLECRECPLRETCPYPAVFEPVPPMDATRLSLQSALPRPFVFSPPDRDPDVIDLVVVGTVARLLPYFVVAFRSIGDAGIGPRRARFTVGAVSSIGPSGTGEVVFHAGDTTVRSRALPIRTEDLIHPGDLDRTAVTLRFRTPTDLKDGGRVMHRPLFGPLIRRLRDRLSALSFFFGDGPLDLDFQRIASLADTVRLCVDGTRRVSVPRRSARTGETHDVGGFIGHARYEGDAIGALMPLLRWAEVLHVGKHAAFGNGAVEVLDG